MATKSKKRNPVATFLCFFFAISIAISSVYAALILWVEGGLRLDYKDTVQFQHVVGELLNNILTHQTINESNNISWIYKNEIGDIWSGNTATEMPQELIDAAEVDLQNENGNYAYLLYTTDTEVVQISRTASHTSIRKMNLRAYPFGNIFTPETIRSDSQIVLTINRNLSNSGSIYYAYYTWYQFFCLGVGLAGATSVSLIVLLGTLIKFRSLSMAHRAIADAINRIWVELKIPTMIAAVFFACIILIETPDSFILGPIAAIPLFLICFWIFWLLLIDLCIYKKQFFTSNILATILRCIRQFESGHPFLQKMKRRFGAFLIIEIGLGLAFVLAIAASQFWWNLDIFFLLIAILIAALGICLFAIWSISYFRGMDSFGEAISYVEQIRKGTAQGPLLLPGEFAELSENLTSIYTGINRAVEERVRSEQMKVELITNVSHDLKTPLTSIMNYVDLLSRENLTPDYANDYVRVLAQKSNRLKNMVQDLFEISKANSGNAELHLERLDVVALVEQTLAELDEHANHSGVEIKTQISAEGLLVWADGKKLHRVFENLLGNALKYSLSNTRVYISVDEAESCAVIAFKNVSSYEMRFTADEIVERFQRGDTSRTTDGSGLGLAIAKSFLELCGGFLKIELDGDLFKAIVILPLADESQGWIPTMAQTPIEPMPQQAAEYETQETAAQSVAAQTDAPSKTEEFIAEPENAQTTKTPSL